MTEPLKDVAYMLSQIRSQSFIDYIIYENQGVKIYWFNRHRACRISGHICCCYPYTPTRVTETRDIPVNNTMDNVITANFDIMLFVLRCCCCC